MYHKTGPYHLPAHVTVYPPFNSKLSLKEIAELLRKQFETVQAKQLTWNTYGTFEGKNNVFYFKPNTESAKFLKLIHAKTHRALGKNISDTHTRYISIHPDHPHITIAEHLSAKMLANIKLQLTNLTPPLHFSVSRVDIYQRNPKSHTYTKVRHVLLQKPTDN